MTGKVVHQQCWNHSERGAVCLCPVCHRGYCRECVSEHDSRLLCAACIKAALPASDAGGSRRSRKVWIPVLAVATTLIAWAAIFSLGQIIMESVTLADRSAKDYKDYRYRE
jgi:hypothetical protein